MRVIYNFAMLGPVSITSLMQEDWEAARSIYLQGIATGQATFQQQAPGWSDWNTAHLPNCRLVARVVHQVVGFAALGSVSSRHVYRGVAEVSIYVASEQRGRGIGRLLLGELIKESEAAGIWTLQAGIFPENTASLALHREAGFRTVGTREKLGEMNGIWRDVMLLERRSAVAGK